MSRVSKGLSPLRSCPRRICLRRGVRSDRRGRWIWGWSSFGRRNGPCAFGSPGYRLRSESVWHRDLFSHWRSERLPLGILASWSLLRSISQLIELLPYVQILSYSLPAKSLRIELPDAASGGAADDQFMWSPRTSSFLIFDPPLLVANKWTPWLPFIFKCVVFACSSLFSNPPDMYRSWSDSSDVSHEQYEVAVARTSLSVEM